MRGWSIAALATEARVSPAMISKIERAEVSATAVILGRLSGAFGITLSTLLEDAESSEQLVRKERQAVWTDPATGYVRRSISPRASPLELVEITLPPGQSVDYPAQAYTFIRQQVWVLEGKLTVAEGNGVHELHVGDCLAFGPPQDSGFANKTGTPCRYLVAIMKSRS